MGQPALDTDPHGFDRMFRSGLDTAEIASRTGCAEAYVANTLHRMREARVSPVVPAANDCADSKARETRASRPNSWGDLYLLARRKKFPASDAIAFANRNVRPA